MGGRFKPSFGLNGILPPLDIPPQPANVPPIPNEARCPRLFPLAVSLACPQDVSPSAARWEQLSQQAEQLRQQGLINDAIPVEIEAVKVAAATFGLNDRRVGLTYDWLGRLCKDLDMYADADSAFRRALDNFKAEPQSVQKNQDLSAVLLHLADLYAGHGRWGEAEHDFRDALTATVQAYGQEDPHVADVLRDGANRCIGKASSPVPPAR